MAERDTTQDAHVDSGATPSRDLPAVPPKKVPLVLAILLTALLPAAAAGIWLGGRLHVVDDRPAAAKRPARVPGAPEKPRPDSGPSLEHPSPSRSGTAMAPGGKKP